MGGREQLQNKQDSNFGMQPEPPEDQLLSRLARKPKLTCKYGRRSFKRALILAAVKHCLSEMSHPAAGESFMIEMQTLIFDKAEHGLPVDASKLSKELTRVVLSHQSFLLTAALHDDR